MKSTSLHFLKQAAQYQQAGELDLADECCRCALADAPAQPDALHLLAVVCAQRKQHKEALQWFGAAAQANPANPDVHANWANALWEGGDYRASGAACQTALAINPIHAQALNVWGNVLLSQHLPAQAAAVFQQLLAVHPRHAHAFNNLGNALQLLHRWADAVQAYKQALALQPTYANAWLNLGQALKKSGDIPAAFAAVGQAVSLTSNDRAVAFALADVSPMWCEYQVSRQLVLKPFQESDADYLADCYANATFMRQYNAQMPRHMTAEGLREKLRKSSGLHPCQTRSVDWVIHHKASGRRVGLANIVDLDFTQRRGEFLIGLPCPEQQPAGTGLEASLVALDFAFNQARLHKLTSLVYDHNSSALHNTEQLGFIHESLLRQHLWNADERRYINLHGWGMTEDDFRANRRLARLSIRLLGRDITADGTL